jgi:hypothetical protein
MNDAKVHAALKNLTTRARIHQDSRRPDATESHLLDPADDLLASVTVCEAVITRAGEFPELASVNSSSTSEGRIKCTVCMGEASAWLVDDRELLSC